VGELKALITGINGFAASHLGEYLLSQGVEVCGTIRPRRSIAHIPSLNQRVALYEVELTEASEVAKVINEIRPDLIFHLAAQASVSKSWKDLQGTLVNNIVAQLNVLQAVIASEIDPKILILGSEEEYGMLYPEELPVKEENPLRPTNPYGVSKVAQDMMGYQYFHSHGLGCVRVRPFNHIGSRQGENFVVASFAKQVAEAEAGLREPILRVGNIQVKRDFTDVRDMVRGYYLALLQGEAGEVYNIGSGRMTSLKWVLNFFLNRSQVALFVEQDPARLRPGEVMEVVCDYSKFEVQTGWRPEIPLEGTLGDVLAYWRERVKSESSDPCRR
jgi:GDP-4-dehydro-6-deoxy-D-mannose reductase